MEDFAFSLANEEIMEIATNFVEKYTDFVENLPFDLQRHVTRLREIDCACREILSEIEALYASFVKEKDLNLIRKSYHILMKIQHLFRQCQELGDEKIEIVQQITELIENKKKAVEHSSHKFKAIFRPDQKSDYNGKRELNKHDYQKNVKRSRRNRPNYNGKHEKVKMTMADPMASTSYPRFSITGSSSNAQFSSEKPRSSLDGGSTKNPQVLLKLRDEVTFTARKTEKIEKKEASPASSASSGSSVSSPSTSATVQKSSISKPNSNKPNLPTSKVTVPSSSSNGANKNAANKAKKKKKRAFKPIEKPSARSPSPHGDFLIDPDEPTYCICQQVSFGQMIGCDNKKCPIEWFHFGCVSLIHKPKGRWFCPNCQANRKKEGKKEHR